MARQACVGLGLSSGALRLAGLLGLVLLASLAAPGPVSASTLRLATTCLPDQEGCDGLVKQAVYRAQGVEVNEVALSLTADGDGLVVTDAGAVITSANGCVTDPADPHRATCNPDGARFARTDLELGAGDDTLRIAAAPGDPQGEQLGVSAKGGDGADTLTPSSDGNTLAGDAGDDTLTGGASPDLLNGGDGDDQLDGRGGDDGLDGGLGSDTIVGSDGRDRVSYTGRGRGVHVDLEGDRDDGEPGEGDLVDTSVENASGGFGSDELIGDERPNLLDGGQTGDDLLVGAGGDDYLLLSSYLAAGLDRAFGGDGNDRLEGGGELDGGAGDDILLGRDLADVLSGGEGDDQLVGYRGRDRIDGGPGDDDIDARVGSYRPEPRDLDPGDEVDCGSGDDIAFPSDDVLSNCEQLAVAASCHDRTNCVASGVLRPVARPRREVGGGRMRLGYRDRKLVMRLSSPGRRLLERRGRIRVRSDVTVRAWNYRPKSTPGEPNRRGKVSTFRSSYLFTLAAR